jgi:hypothetical protein
MFVKSELAMGSVRVRLDKTLVERFWPLMEETGANLDGVLIKRSKDIEDGIHGDFDNMARNGTTEESLLVL